MNWQSWLTIGGVGAAGLYLGVRCYRMLTNRSGCAGDCSSTPAVRDGIKRKPLVSIGTPSRDKHPPPPTNPH